jgi:molecular chaperone HscB
MTQPVLCDSCASLNPLPAVTDHFALLGLPRRFELDEKLLHERYVALSRHSHPDFHANDDPEVRMLALQVSSSVNDAYRTLSDPVLRAGYLLGLLGGSSMAQEKSVPEGFLSSIMMLQEEFQDAKAAGDAKTLGDLGEVLRNQKEGFLRRVRTAFEQLDSASACEAARQDVLHEIRQLLNAVAYVRKMMTLM